MNTANQLTDTEAVYDANGDLTAQRGHSPSSTPPAPSVPPTPYDPYGANATAAP